MVARTDVETVAKGRSTRRCHRATTVPNGVATAILDNGPRRLYSNHGIGSGNSKEPCWMGRMGQILPLRVAA
jgi:hypothetical protein